MKDWDWETNLENGIDPDAISYASHKVIFWKCSKCGHKWSTPAYNRTTGGHGCPSCDGEKRTSFPEQAIGFYLEQKTKVLYRHKIEKREADIFLPDMQVAIEYDGYFFHNKKESKIRDHKKDEFFMKKNILLIRVKETRQYGALVETKKEEYGYSIIAPYNQKYTFMEDLMNEISKILFGVSNFDVDIQNDRARILRRYLKNIKENSVAFQKPLGIKKWDYAKNGNVDPRTVPVSSKKRFFWKCPTCGHCWEGAVENLINSLTCSKCVHSHSLHNKPAGIESGYSLEALFPSLAEEWHPTKNGHLKPTDVTPGSNKKVWWKCKKCGNEWQAIIKTRCKGYGCKKCSYDKRRVTTTRKNGSLFGNMPELLDQWDYAKNIGVDIDLVAPKSRTEYWWKCPKGHSYKSSPIVKSGSPGCPICSGKRTDATNSLSTLDPELCLLWDYHKNPYSPENYTPNSGKFAYFICPNCHGSFYKRIQQMHYSKKCPLCKHPFRKGNK